MPDPDLTRLSPAALDERVLLVAVAEAATKLSQALPDHMPELWDAEDALDELRGGLAAWRAARDGVIKGNGNR